MNQNTGHSDGAGEQGGDPRPYRQQASERLPRGGKLALAARQKGCQGISQRGVPRHRDPPRAGRPVVRRPRLRSVLARATHQKPRRANVFEASRYPRPSGRVQITSRRTSRVLRRGSRVPPPGSPGRSQEVVVGHHVRARPRDGGGRVEAMLRATGAWRQDGRQGHPGHRRPPRPLREGSGPFPGAAYAKRKPRLVRTANGSGAQVR